MKRIKINKFAFIGLLITFVLIIGGIAVASPLWDFQKVAEGTKDILAKDDGSLIASVDGIGISQSQFDLYRDQYDNVTTQIKMSDQDIIDKLVEKQVLLNEAERLGIAATYQEVKKEADYVYQQLNVGTKSDNEEEKANAKEVLGYMEDFAKGLGVSLEEYKVQYDIPKRQQQMSIAAVYEHYIVNLPQTTKANNDLTQEAYQQYVDQLIKEADIEYFN